MNHNHKFLSEELLIPSVDKTDGSRTNMVASQLNQLLILNNAEKPLVFTNFENQVGEVGRGIKYFNQDYTVKKVVVINDYRALLVLYLHEDNTIHVVEFNSFMSLSESFGYTNELQDEIEEEETLEKDKWLYKNTMYDDVGNLTYGVNLKTTYLSFKGMTFEDAMVISESAAKKLSHTEVTKLTIVLNQNDILIGDIDVGTEIKNGIVALRRRISKDNLFGDFKDSNINLDILPEDTVFYSNGIVTDIKVFTNLDEEELSKSHNSKVKEVFDNEIESLQDFVDSLNELEKEYVLTEDSIFYRKGANEYLARIPWVKDDVEYDGTVIELTIANSFPAALGSKLTGRHGGKGVVSAVLPDNEMPMGCDIVLNALGVAGRLNIAQSFEHELNFIAADIRRRSSTYRDFSKDIMRFFEMTSKSYHDFLCSINKKDLDKSLKEMYKTGEIYIHQAPFYGNVNFNDLIDIYEEFNVQKIKVEGIHDELVVGDMYFVKLKHEAKLKYSVRSTGQLNLTDIPYRSSEKFKKGNQLYNTNPIKMGEQELFNMLLLEDSEKVAKFLSSYSSSSSQRTMMHEELLTKDVDKIDSFSESDEDSNSSSTLKALFKGIGVTLKTKKTELS